MDEACTNLFNFGDNDFEKIREDIRARVGEKMSECAIRYIVGISGDADPDRRVEIESILESFTLQFQGGDYAILTGGTEGGVPQLGVEVAKKLEIPTIGVFPKQGRKYALLKSLDIAIETSSPDIGDGIFGSETPTYVSMLDGATIIGGSYGTLTEASTILKTNSKRARDRARGVDGALPPLYFAPISGTGGVADLAYSIRNNLGDDIGSSMPRNPVATGEDAAQFIKDSLESHQN